MPYHLRAPGNVKIVGAVSSLVLLLLPSSSFGRLGITPKKPDSGVVNWQKTWCVAKPSLLANVNYARSQVDCGVFWKGCFSPDNPMTHVSVALNLYYQAKGRNKWNCDFRNSGLIVVTYPGYGNCIYA